MEVEEAEGEKGRGETALQPSFCTCALSHSLTSQEFTVPDQTPNCSSSRLSWKNASSNQNNPLPRTKWERWFINNLWSLLWPLILPCTLHPICHNFLSVLPFISLPNSPSLPYLPNCPTLTTSHQNVISNTWHLLATWSGPATLLRVLYALTLLILTVYCTCYHDPLSTGDKFEA